MTVVLTSPVEGGSPGDKYTGENETFLLENGYARAVDPNDIPDPNKPAHYSWPKARVEDGSDGSDGSGGSDG